jgi:cytochrome c556
MKTLVQPLLIVSCLLLLASPAWALEATEASKRADHYYVSAGKTYNMHANDHARMLGKYAKASDKPVPAEVIKEHTAAIRANVVRAQKQFANLTTSAQANPDVAKQLAEIQKRLAQVTQKLDSLETSKDADAKLVVSATDAITADLKATHDTSKAVDQALNNVVENEDSEAEFDNRDSSSYYFTGEGHFID